MSLRSFLQKIPKYRDFIAFFCFLFILYVMLLNPVKSIFDYFLIIFSIGGLFVDGLSIYLTLTSAK
jgi:hypothetical protein